MREEHVQSLLRLSDALAALRGAVSLWADSETELANTHLFAYGYDDTIWRRNYAASALAAAAKEFVEVVALSNPVTL